MLSLGVASHVSSSLSPSPAVCLLRVGRLFLPFPDIRLLHSNLIIHWVAYVNIKPASWVYDLYAHPSDVVQGGQWSLWFPGQELLLNAPTVEWASSHRNENYYLLTPIPMTGQVKQSKTTLQDSPKKLK